MSEKDTGVVEFEEYARDFGIFVAWMVVGMVVGWVVHFVAHGVWMQSPLADFYGAVGAALAVLWAAFRRQKHLEHLPHVRKHLEKIAGKK